MEIKRRGSKRDHGWKKVLYKENPKIDWDKISKCLKIKINTIRDEMTNNTYDYEVSLNIDDMKKIIESLAENGVADCPDEISQKFSGQLDKLLKIMICSIGIVPPRNTAH